jgi:fructose-1-phosphate kinase PfkB-like protein
MGIKIGDIDIAQQTLDNEFRLGVLEKLLEQIVNKNPNLAKPDQNQLNQIRKEVIEKLQVKYPNSGIEFKKQ